MNDIEILEEKIKQWKPYKNVKWTTPIEKEIARENQAIENLINRVKELEEDKRITELTKISCCTAQNCEALNNAIREGLENNKLRERIVELEEIEQEHRKQNGKLQEKTKEYEKILEAYNVISTDYMPKDNKIIIADREYFNNGILKETCIPKSKIKEVLEQRLKKYKDADDGKYKQDYLTRGEYELLDRYKECSELLKILCEEDIYKIDLDYIQKSKIEEKIEELCNKYQKVAKVEDTISVSMYNSSIDYKIQVLQELLEEQEDK